LPFLVPLPFLLPLPPPFGCHPSPEAEDLLLSLPFVFVFASTVLVPLPFLLPLPPPFGCHPSPEAEDLLLSLPFVFVFASAFPRASPFPLTVAAAFWLSSFAGGGGSASVLAVCFRLCRYRHPANPPHPFKVP
jgi:hypothetical protein